MKIKKWVLILLLTSFVFVVMHDFVMNKIDPSTQTELTFSQIEQVPLCDVSSLHELLHASMMVAPCPCEDQGYHDSSNIAPYIEPKSVISSRYLHSLFRPPIV